jgi:hypothetical protein
MPISFDLTACSVGTLFSNGKVYCLPSFQRSYSWPEDRALQLLDDLYTAHTQADGETGTEYFLGPIILRSNGSSPSDIVDGQQRIVTLAALLAVIRDRIQDKDLKKELQAHLYRTANTTLQFDNSPRIVVTKVDRDDFQKLIVSIDGTLGNFKPASRAMKKLAQIVRKFHMEFPDISSAAISKFASFILTRCDVVVLSTTSLEDACKVFRSVNTPGQPLSDVAFARHELIKGLSDEPESIAWELGEDWDSLHDQLGEDELRSYFLAVARLVKPDHDSADLIQFIKSIRDNGVLLQSFRTKIRNFIHNYHQLGAAALDFREDSDLINAHVSSLNAFDVKEWRTPALLWLSLGRNGAETAKFFSLLNALVLGLIVLHGKSSKRLSKRIDIVTDAIANGSMINSATSPIRFDAEEWDKIQVLIERPKSEFAKHLLIRLNARLSPDELKSIFPVKAEIEHVLPRNPQPGSSWTQLFDAQELDHYTSLLGNLALLNKKANSGASNRDFDYKKKKLFGMNNNQCFAITNYIASQDVWDASRIEARHRSLIGLARQLLRPY